MVDSTNITPPRVSFLDERTGFISREWYRFLLYVFTEVNDAKINVRYLKTAPATQPPNENDIIDAAGLFAQRAEIDLSNVDAMLQALAVQPANTPQSPRLRYGSFYDTTDQVAAAINTAYAMTFNNTDLSNGVYVGSPTSRIYVDTHNVYDIQFSAQLLNTAGGAHDVWIWLRKNGVDVPNSATSIRIEGNNTKQVAAWNFLLSLNSGDYFELMWEVSDLAVTLDYEVASAVHPAIPSLILTVTDNISS